MNPATETAAGWSRGRFWFAVIVIFAGQIGWIMLLGARGHILPAPVPRREVFRVLSSPLTEEQWLKQVFAVDPTVFPASSSHGFADLAWHQLPASDYSVPLPKPVPAFLEFQASRIDAGLGPKTAPLLHFPFRIEDQLAGKTVALPADSGGRQRSFFRVDGSLASRQIDPPLSLPAWTTNYLLTNTVVRFGVNRAGQVISEAMLSGSGLSEADDAALAAARVFRFRPVPGSADAETWNTATFYWKTVSPPTTNTP